MVALAPLKNFFQHGYVTNDIDRAKATFSGFYGIEAFHDIPHRVVQIAAGREAVMSIALAYHGALMIELIQPESGDCEIYREILPEDGFAIRLHHHGYLLYDHEEWRALRDAYAARGAATVVEGGNARSGNAYFYADTRAELGHYVEYISLTEQGEKDFAAIPNSAPR